MATCYATLFRQLFHHEAGLYLDLFGSESRPGIPSKDVFMVKTIGDEIWIVVNAPPKGTYEFNRYCKLVFDACLAMVSKTLDIACFERRLTAEEELTDPEMLGLKSLRKQLALKATVDLLEQHHEISALRLDAFLRSLGPSRRDEEAIVRLAGGVITANSGTPRPSVATRTDFIGFDVDRFFRCTKEAVKMQVVAGESLVAGLKLAEGEALPESAGGEVTVSLEISEHAVEPLTIIRGEPKNLPGIPGLYSVFRISNPMLAGIYLH